MPTRHKPAPGTMPLSPGPGQDHPHRGVSFDGKTEHLAITLPPAGWTVGGRTCALTLLERVSLIQVKSILPHVDISSTVIGPLRSSTPIGCGRGPAGISLTGARAGRESVEG